MTENAHDKIFLEKKSLMSYVTSAIIQLPSLCSITLKARGLCVGTVMDGTQIILQKTNIFEIDTIQIGSESLESSDGRKRDVSTIEIPVRSTGQLS